MSNTSAEWYLKKKNNTQYGPVSLQEMAQWAQQCRIVAGNQASTNQQDWIPVEDIPELAMEWLAQRKDGKRYGPFPLSAAPELRKHHVLPEDAILTHAVSGTTMNMPDARARLADNQPTPNEKTRAAATPEKMPAATRETSPLEQPEQQESPPQSPPPQQDHQKQQELEAQISALQDALEQSRAESASVLSRDDKQADDIAELRQQVAFMKKNIAALNAQLLTARNTAAQRAKLLAVAWVVVTVSLAALLVMLLTRGCQPSPTAQAHATPPQAEHNGTTESLAPITDQTPARRDAPAQPTQPTGDQPPAPRIQITGISVTAQDPDTQMLRFDEGIFSSLDTLSSEGRQQLDDLARQLPRNLEGWEMIMQGHTDNIPMRSTSRFADNRALALARAETVAQHFVRRAGFPADAIKPQASTTAPFPNDTAENRIRNRTVTIELRRR